MEGSGRSCTLSRTPRFREAVTKSKPSSAAPSPGNTPGRGGREETRGDPTRRYRLTPPAPLCYHPPMPPGEHMRAVIQEHVDAENARDPARVLAPYSRDGPAFDDVPAGARY